LRLVQWTTYKSNRLS